MPKKKGFIVEREIADNGPMGSTYGYRRVETPKAGERIYHGKFRPRSVACGQLDADSMIVYDYVGEGEPSSEIWNGEGDGSVEEF